MPLKNGKKNASGDRQSGENLEHYGKIQALMCKPRADTACLFISHLEEKFSDQGGMMNLVD